MLSVLSMCIAGDNFAGWNYYLGDPHAHTGVSGDGMYYDPLLCPHCGTAEEIFTRALEQGLDWVAFSEHVNTSTAATPQAYRSLHLRVLSEEKPGLFITLPAAEVALTDEAGQTLGHRTLLLFGDATQLADLEATDLQYDGIKTDIGGCEEIHTWAAELEARLGPLLLMPHHPAALLPASVDWSCHHPAYEPLVEVYSEHGSSMYTDFAWDPPNSGGDATGAVETALDPAGYALKMGFAAGSDSHDSDPGGVCSLDESVAHATGGGLTVAVLPETESLSRPALYQAFVERRTYATTGPFLPLQIQYFSLGQPLGTLGQDLELPQGQPLQVQLSYPAEFQPWIHGISLHGVGQRWGMNPLQPGLWELNFPSEGVPELLYVSIELAGEGWNTGFCEDGGSDDSEWIWLSPSWVSRSKGDVDGDGWSWAEGDCAEGDPDIGPGEAEIWYDGVDQNCDGRDDDLDEDGFLHAQDCNDRNAHQRPDAEEIWYDGIDQNCDGRDDDQDFDAFGIDRDCDDLNAEIRPDAEEIWYDGVDQNCDGYDDDQDQDGLSRSQDCDDLSPAPCEGTSGCGRSALLLFLLPFCRRGRVGFGIP